MPRGIKASIICPDCGGNGTPLCGNCTTCNGTGSIKPDRKPRTPKTTKQVKNDKPVVMSLSDDELCHSLELAYDNLLQAYNIVTDRLSHRIDKEHIAYLHQAYDLSETRLFKVFVRMHKIIIGE